MLYGYLKKGPVDNSSFGKNNLIHNWNLDSSDKPIPSENNVVVKKKVKVLPVLLMFFGVILLGSVFSPILFYQILLSPKFSELVSPVSSGSSGRDPFSSIDRGQTSSWMPNSQTTINSVVPKVSRYSLSIPKLNINEANVEIGGEDLKKYLVHYGGTAVPGQPGNAVIFGHSILPQFYNPTNYLTIFSTLPTLKNGDEIFVKFDDVLYTYQVEHMIEVKPNDSQILEQRYDDSYITLVTCVPPGTYLKRLLVVSRLKKI